MQCHPIRFWHDGAYNDAVVRILRALHHDPGIPQRDLAHSLGLIGVSVADHPQRRCCVAQWKPWLHCTVPAPLFAASGPVHKLSLTEAHWRAGKQRLQDMRGSVYIIATSLIPAFDLAAKGLGYWHGQRPPEQTAAFQEALHLDIAMRGGDFKRRQSCTGYAQLQRYTLHAHPCVLHMTLGTCVLFMINTVEQPNSDTNSC